MPSTINVTLLGDAAPAQVAVWVCGVALTILFGALIARAKGSRDLRFLTYCMLVGLFGILGFAYLTTDPASSKEFSTAPARVAKADGSLASTIDGGDAGAVAVTKPSTRRVRASE